MHTHIHVHTMYTSCIHVHTQLGDPRAAIFKVVRYQQHPEVPDSMSKEAKNFCERYVRDTLSVSLSLSLSLSVSLSLSHSQTYPPPLVAAVSIRTLR